MYTIRKGLGWTLLALCLSGCASLEAWERGHLAQPGMDFSDDPLLSSYQRHVEFSKEAATGDAALAGSGCGCN